MEENEMLTETDIRDVNEELFCDDICEETASDEINDGGEAMEEDAPENPAPEAVPEAEKYERTGIYMTDEKASADSLLRRAFGLA